MCRWDIPASRCRIGDLEAKFCRLAAGRLNRPRIDRLIEFVWTLDRVRDIGTLMPVLRVKDRGSG